MSIILFYFTKNINYLIKNIRTNLDADVIFNYVSVSEESSSEDDLFEFSLCSFFSSIFDFESCLSILVSFIWSLKSNYFNMFKFSRIRTKFYVI